MVSGLSLILFLTAATPAGDIRWSFGPVVPMAKDCRATVAVGDQIVTVGGTFWETTPSGAKVKRWTSKVFQLDTRTLDWSTLPEYPVQAGYAFAAAIGSRIYVVGGRGEDRGNAEVFVLDMSAQTRGWISGPRLPEARWGQAGAVIEDVIYIAGGSMGSPFPAGRDSLAADVLALDTKRPELGWRRVATLPRPKTQWQMSAGCRGEFYLFGGLVLTSDGPRESLIPQVEAFALNISTRKWRELRPLPAPVGSGAAVAIGSRSIVLSGGYALALPGSSGPDHQARIYFTNECLLYDTVRGNYRSLKPMKIAVGDQGCVYLKHRLFVMGGENAACLSRTDSLQIAGPF